MATTKDYELGDLARYPTLHRAEQAASSASDRSPLADDFRIDGRMKEIPPVKFAPRIRVLLVTAVVLLIAALGHALLGDLIGSVFAPRETPTVSASADPQDEQFQHVGHASPYIVPANAGWQVLFSPAHR